MPVFFIRETGISQAALAQYIGAKTSTLNYHLAGTRLLVGKASQKLVNLTVSWCSYQQIQLKVTMPVLKKEVEIYEVQLSRRAIE